MKVQNYQFEGQVASAGNLTSQSSDKQHHCLPKHVFSDFNNSILPEF